MATLIPALGAFLSRMTAGERWRCKLFRFEGVGFQVQGRIRVLKFNCRDTRQILLFASPREEKFAIADQLSLAYSGGQAWGDMAIVCIDALRQRIQPRSRRLPCQDLDGQQRPGVSRGGAARRGALPTAMASKRLRGCFMRRRRGRRRGW